MKRTLSIFTITAILLAGWLYAADEKPEPAGKRPSASQASEPEASGKKQSRRFTLNFGGGKPQELVQAVSKALGKPVNVIISDDHRDVTLPPVKVVDVTVPELFDAISSASSRTVLFVTSYNWQGGNRVPMYSQGSSSYGFRTSAAPATEDSLWVFYHNAAPTNRPIEDPQPNCRFWNLSGYLGSSDTDPMAEAEFAAAKADLELAVANARRIKDLREKALVDDSEYDKAVANLRRAEAFVKGREGALNKTKAGSYKVEDITTAIETGWKMQGATPTPKLSFHKDTKLLIGVGEPQQLQMVDEVLRQLRVDATASTAPAAATRQ